MSHIICDKKSIALNAIVWLEGDLNYTWIYPYNQPAQLSSYNLKWYESLLTNFIRIRKDAIVNPLQVQALHSISSRPRRLKIVLSTGEQLEVSRRRQAFVRKYFGESTLYSQAL